MLGQGNPRAEGAPRHTPYSLHEIRSAWARGLGVKGEAAKLSMTTPQEKPGALGTAATASIAGLQ